MLRTTKLRTQVVPEAVTAPTISVSSIPNTLTRPMRTPKEDVGVLGYGGPAGGRSTDVTPNHPGRGCTVNSSQALASSQLEPKQVLAQALSLISRGSWTTYTELGEVADLNAQSVSAFLRTNVHRSSHRVLPNSGKPAAFLRSALTREGINFHADGVADEQQKVTSTQIREQLKLAPPLTKSADDGARAADQGGRTRPAPARVTKAKPTTSNGVAPQPPSAAVGSAATGLAAATPELAARLHLPQAWLQDCVDLLDDRPQLVFYGPPGTGKTHLAQQLARHIAGRNVLLAQFHPSYPPDVFFHGLRSAPAGRLTAKPGPLRLLVDQALADPHVPHVLIVDDINRTNVATVFSELSFLIEHRETAAPLLHADGDFALPANVYIIGTMNTGDGAMAPIEPAIRRRFAFLRLHPSEQPTRGVLRSWLVSGGHSTRVADLLDELNSVILDPDVRLGPSTFMRAGAHEGPGLHRTWRTTILPLLEEHHYGELSAAEVEARYGLAAIAARVDRVELADDDADSVAEADSNRVAALSPQS